MRRGIPRGLIPLAVVAVYVIVALAAPLIAPHDPNQTNLAARLLPPFSAASSSGGGARYLLGTDDLGRDVLSRVLYGARVSLAVAAVAVIASGAGGVALGLIAGWRRGWLGIVIMRIADIALSVPFFLIAILVVAVLGPSLVNVVICLAMVRWPRYTRITYATVLETRERGFRRSFSRQALASDQANGRGERDFIGIACADDRVASNPRFGEMRKILAHPAH